MRFLREQDGLDVYLDLESGREMFVGRSQKDRDEAPSQGETASAEKGE